ncbi:MAG: DUF2784 domain-containing protein [Burkholderiaceae bacterium]
MAWLADAVLMLHVAIAVFVVGGLVLTLAGNWRGWRWVNRVGLRVAHALAIAVVTAEAWLGLECPLTTLEQALRVGAGAATYDGGFIAHWLQRLLYYAAPPEVFLVGYTLFAAAVLATWWRYPPVRRRPVGDAHGR